MFEQVLPLCLICHFLDQISPRSAISMGNSSRSGRSGPVSPRSVSSTASQNAVPMKKVIRKSRWVSIHDGRPVSPFVETVTYEPKYGYDSYVGRRPSGPKEILRRSVIRTTLSLA